MSARHVAARVPLTVLPEISVSTTNVDRLLDASLLQTAHRITTASFVTESATASQMAAAALQTAGRERSALTGSVLMHLIVGPLKSAAKAETA